MKKILGIVLIILACIFITGCENQEPYGIGSVEEDKFINLGELGGGIKKYDLICDEIQDVVDYNIDNFLFITTDGELFKINYEQLFSNNKNCKQISSDKKFIKFIKNGIIDENNDIYYVDELNDNQIVKFNFENGYPGMPYIQQISKDKYKNIIYAEINAENFDYLYLENNNLYSINTDEAYLNLQDETIIKVMDNTVITDKNFYIYSQKIINKTECEKYADINCITQDDFSILDNKKIISQYDKIKFVKYNSNNVVFITDINNNIYYGGLYGV